MYKFLIFAAALLSVAAAAANLRDGLTMEVEKILQNNRNLEFIGTVEDKVYLAEKVLPKTFIDANATCTTAGLSLATIHSVAQYNLLISKSTILGSTVEYWTAGNAATTMGQYLWGTSDVAVTSYGTFSPDDVVRSALTFRAVNTANGYFFGRDANTTHYYLCESV